MVAAGDASKGVSSSMSIHNVGTHAMRPQAAVGEITIVGNHQCE